MTTFKDLGLSEPILKALAADGYETPTPIQAQAIPSLLAGRDLMGIAQTGTGKTAAFALPIIEKLVANPRIAPRRGCRTLVLSPTRELASQIADSFRSYSKNLKLSIAVVFGGVAAGPQVRKLANGVDILVATPGRLLDHVDGKMLRLDQVEFFVLDEADQMLDLGFIHSIRRVVPMLPHRRQTMFFSATMPKTIKDLADTMLTDPATVAVTPVAKTADRVEQKVIFVEQSGKKAVLVELLSDPAIDRALVFTRTKHGADKVVRQLEEAGVGSAAIHGNKSQSQRERALGSFRTGHIKILIATDIAARGIDVDGVTHVVNHDIPNVPESYVHRIGRTARAGAEGVAYSLVANDERMYLRDIERLIRQSIPAEDRRSDAGKAEPEGDGAASQKGRQQQRQPRPQGQRPAQGQGKPRQANGSRPNHGEPSRAHEQRRPQGHSAQHGARAEGGRRGSDGDMASVGFMKPSGERPARRPRRGGGGGDRRQG
ncbi:RNA helicase [Methylopila jiangsuensis]|uniref:DEAD-box ATP-dependent RNA helicase RhpA n=1 Tax=Methylopila jiangsuensis TaxID=586230 RepID=A0A9W6N4E6_9HYPH|nr:DEAD/DEAH box helicase [Methylopila jiangsuensis]MDR6286415.1 ATP-dependent RNA helicase RhlE [Methylopila jiangsuensis]GLK77248.1 RNA helicase [Methylopila jiangsuensis]